MAGQGSVLTSARSHLPFAVLVRGERLPRCAGLMLGNAGYPAAQDMSPAVVPAFCDQRRLAHLMLGNPIPMPTWPMAGPAEHSSIHSKKVCYA